LPPEAGAAARAAARSPPVLPGHKPSGMPIAQSWFERFFGAGRRGEARTVVGEPRGAREAVRRVGCHHDRHLRWAIREGRRGLWLCVEVRRAQHEMTPGGACILAV
jgi:hypothetical protein